MEAEKIFNLVAEDMLRHGVCRVCLKENEDLFNIFESSYGKYNTISEIFDRMFSKKVISGDGYPEAACLNCIEKAAKALEFKEKFYNSIGKKNNGKISNIEEGVVLIVQAKNGECTQYICNKIETRNNDLTFDKNSSDSIFFCQNCVIPFFTRQALSDHMVSCFRCEICKATHTNVGDLKIHKNIHKRAHETACPHCGGLLKRGFHSSDNFNYPCQECHFVFPCVYFLNQHVQIEHACVGNESLVDRDLKDNKQVISSGIKPTDSGSFKCTLCNKTFNTLLGANTHCNSLNCIYICDICGANYKIKSQLKIHMMDKHLGVRPHLCYVCGRSFVRRSMLVSHQQVHIQEKRFQCYICEKKFVSVATLRYHSRLHTGEKPYVCSLCGEAFVKSSRLKEHEQKWHIGKLQCPKCGTTFSQRSSLKTHMDRFHPKTYSRNESYLMKEQTSVVSASNTEDVQTDNFIVNISPFTIYLPDQ